MSIESKIKTGNYEFASPWWDHISESVKELITRLLDTNSSQRWNAQQVLSHPWLLGTCTDQIQIQSKELCDPFRILDIKNLKTPLPIPEEEESSSTKDSYFDALHGSKSHLLNYVNAPVDHYLDHYQEESDSIQLDKKKSNLFQKRKSK